MMQAVCQAIDYGGTTGGSFVPLLESLSRAVLARGADFHVIASEVPKATWVGDLERAGARVHLVHDAGEAFSLVQYLKPQIVHSHFHRYDFVAALSERRARVFWHVHSQRSNVSPLARAKGFFRHRVLGRRVEAIVPVSQALASECRLFFAPTARIRLIYNGVDTHRFRPPTPSERNAARLALGIAPHERIIVFFDRAPLKGGSTLREALGRLPEFRLLAVGANAADYDGLQSAASPIFIQRAADTREMYWAADVLALPSEKEGLPFVFLEALACGLPVAGSDIPAVAEIGDGIPELVRFAVGDAGALAASLRRAAEVRPHAGRERTAARFGIERWTNEILELYSL